MRLTYSKKQYLSKYTQNTAFLAKKAKKVRNKNG